MKRLSKVIFIALIALLGLIGASLIGAAIYIRSDAARAQLEQALADALDAPVRIGRISASGTTLRADALSVPAPDGHTTPLIVAKSLRASFRLSPLLRGELQLHDIVLDEPRLTWPQDAAGRWTWPSPAKKDEPKPGPTTGAKPDAQGSKKALLIDGVVMRRGTVELLDAARQPVIVASEVEAQFTQTGDPRTAGTLAAAQITWNQRYVFAQVRTPFRYEKGALHLEELTSTLLRGEVRGRLSLDTRGDGRPFDAHVELRAVDLADYAKAAGWADGEIAGKLTGSADVRGEAGELAKLEGPGHLSIEGGHFRKLEIFESVGQLLDLAELANLQPREATMQFQLRDEKAFIEALALGTGSLRITATGVARFDSKLALDARLAVSEQMHKTMPDAATANLARLDDGTYGLDFKVNGNIDKPKTDLAEKLMGGKVRNKVSDLLGGLFGNKPKEKKKDDKDTPTAPQ